MILDRAKVANAEKIFKAALLKGFTTAQPVIEPIALVETITGDEVENIGATANLQMREWNGERQIGNIRQFSHKVAVKPYEKTLGIEKRAFLTDQWGRYTRIISDMGQQAAILKSQLMAQVLTGSSEATGYDDLKLAAATHKIGNFTFDNTATAALSLVSLRAARTFFGSLKNESGQPMGLMPTHLVTSAAGSAYETAKELMTSETILVESTLVKNPMKGEYSHIANPWISSQTFWALLCLNGPDRPVIIYGEAEPKFVMITDEQNDHVFKKGEYLAGLEYWTVAAVGAWYTAYISTGAA